MKLYQVPVEDIRDADLGVSDHYRYVAMNCETMVLHRDANSQHGKGIAIGFGLGVAFSITLMIVL